MGIKKNLWWFSCKSLFC